MEKYLVQYLTWLVPIRRRYNRTTMEDARRWADKYQNRKSILKIAEEEGVDPGTVSGWLHKIGFEIRPGQHFVPQLPLKLPAELVLLVSEGQDQVIRFLEDRVWGLRMSEVGLQQLKKFCEFVKLYDARFGVEKTAGHIGAHRSTVAEWRNGTDLPYLIRVVMDTLGFNPSPEWKALPFRLESGGNVPKDWILVPSKIRTIEDITKVISELRPLNTARTRAVRFGIETARLSSMKVELFAYLLGVMLGDASKLGGTLQRFVSANLDLQLTLKHPSNERMGEFVCLAANCLGLEMDRIANKRPSGTTRFGKQPSEAFRWASARSPFIAWMFNVGLGLRFDQTTSTDPVHMEWIQCTPRIFRVRFIQGIADSDGTVKPSEIVIVSVPNAQFITSLLKGVGMTTAHTVYEKGQPLRTMVNRNEASTLPAFNEFVAGYRFKKALRLDETE